MIPAVTLLTVGRKGPDLIFSRVRFMPDVPSWGVHGTRQHGYPTSRTTLDGVATRRCSGRTPQQRCSTSTRDRRRGEAARVLEQTLGNRSARSMSAGRGHRDLSSEEEAHVAQLER